MCVGPNAVSYTSIGVVYLCVMQCIYNLALSYIPGKGWTPHVLLLRLIEKHPDDSDLRRMLKCLEPLTAIINLEDPLEQIQCSLVSVISLV